MLRVSLMVPDAAPEQGGAELIERWHSEGGHLWVDMEGAVGDAERSLLESFGISDLAIRDAARKRHPPKIETFSDYSFLIFRGIRSLGENLDLEPQQLSLFLGDNWMVTQHDGPAVSVNQLWTDLAAVWEKDFGRLTLKLLHTIAGRYLEAVLAFEDRLADLEDMILGGDAEDAMRELTVARSRLRVLRRVFNYHERVAAAIVSGISPQLGEGSGPEERHYHERRDLHDRCERLLSLCSMYYEICGDLIESYISLSSHRLNNTMKVLTIITALFVPLSFLAGLYGMNFDHMPELHYRYAYYVLLGVMATLAAIMIGIFRRIRWL